MNGEQRKWQFAFFAWMTGIILVSLVSFSGLPKVEVRVVSGLDKIIHFLMYFVFAVLYLKSFCTQTSPNQIVPVSCAAFALMYGLLLGLLLEFTQESMSYGRHFEYWDMFANTLGLLFGIGCYHLFSKPKM